ncbi:hypothetical protein Fmac_017664 [Flemingia macrophylla]|uniref:Uncharacterized protein n=1 Tax=Flemingia macrophylla TaxID=520843 RepID=A0ABD1M2R1_9FABA
MSSTERFLGVPSHASRSQNPHDDDNLIEDDVVFSHNDNDSTEPSSSFSPIPSHHHHYHDHHHKAFAFGPPDAFGILATLPENDHLSPNGSHFYHHKPSFSVSLSSSSSSSSSSLIPTIPKPPPDRTLSSSVKFHQSAPVNVSLMPPHEIMARNSAQTTPRSPLSPLPPSLPRRGATRN